MLINDLLIESITDVIMKSLLMEDYDKDNFFSNTYGVFTACNEPSAEPDYMSINKRGYASSCYWYTNEGVYRTSNHWSEIYVDGLRYDVVGNKFDCENVASCWWVFKCNKNNKDSVCGFCPWENFKTFNENMALRKSDYAWRFSLFRLTDILPEEYEDLTCTLVYKEHMTGEELQNAAYKWEKEKLLELHNS